MCIGIVVFIVLYTEAQGVHFNIQYRDTNTDIHIYIYIYTNEKTNKYLIYNTASATRDRNTHTRDSVYIYIVTIHQKTIWTCVGITQHVA